MTSPGFDIIMLALPRWDGPYSSTAYSLAKELSRHTRVFYIDNPFTYKDYFSGKNTASIQKRKNALLKGEDIFTTPDVRYPQLTVVTPKLTLPINWLPAGALYDALSKVNDRIVHRAIRQTIDSFNIKQYVYINSFNPLFNRYLNVFIKPILNVYHCVDDISKSAYVAKHGARLEAKAVADADLTIVTSTELKRLKSSQGKHVYFLPNAADTTLFQRAVQEPLEKPVELQSIPEGKKIICYMGNICHRLDYDLLVKVADHHADKVLLMIGPLSKDEYKTSGLASRPNVLFAGKKGIEELPAYLKYSDCCIIPFRLIDLTRSIYPLKINEYLSAGKPVVTTRFSEDIATFEGVAAVCDSHTMFIDAITDAIDSDSPRERERRVAYSNGNNWIARAQTLITILTDHVQKHGARR